MKVLFKIRFAVFTLDISEEKKEGKWEKTSL